MAEKCPCEIYANSCCACVSMHCDECHGHSKFVQGRFCSNCGRPLKAELARAYVPMSEVEEAVKKVVGATDKVICEAKADIAREIFEEIEKEIDMNLLVISKILNAKGGRASGKTVLISKYDVFIEAKKHLDKLKKKYTEGEAQDG